MIRLQTTEGISLSEKVRNISTIEYDPIQIKNKLLDGSQHVQTIGTPSKFIRFEVLSNQSQVDIINFNNANGTKFKFVDDGVYYVGLLDEQLQWERLTPRYKDEVKRKYTAAVRLNIKEEGQL